jgi:16S rRNA (guanine966-N2)-methyltransferase
MRVIAGIAKGHQLKVPDVSVTRPATDLVRGAIFSILESLTDDWAQVLDIFSGSGAMGIEALSRGADWADFVDRNRKCCNIIKENLEKTKFLEQAHVYCVNADKALTFLDKEYSIIIMDPPYANTAIGDFITKVANSRLVGKNTVVVVTHSSHLTLDRSYGEIKMIKERRHGDSYIAIYRKEDNT